VARATAAKSIGTHLKAGHVSPLETLWHFLNFFAPAIGVGLVAPLLAKLFWRRSLKGRPWLTLSAWATAGALLALVGGLVLSGRDGRVSTYAAMAAGSALALWWAGFVRQR
jgi:hypothetical protein